MENHQRFSEIRVKWINNKLILCIKNRVFIFDLRKYLNIKKLNLNIIIFHILFQVHLVFCKYFIFAVFPFLMRVSYLDGYTILPSGSPLAQRISKF